MRHNSDVIHFEGVGPCFYERGAFRPPKAGEFYLSGAIPAAYKAPSDFSPGSRYQIVTATKRALRTQAWRAR